MQTNKNDRDYRRRKYIAGYCSYHGCWEPNDGKWMCVHHRAEQSARTRAYYRKHKKKIA